MAKNAKAKSGNRSTQAPAQAAARPLAEPSRFIEQRPPFPIGDDLLFNSSLSVRAHWSGPLPMPSVMEGYQHLIPDAPERILRLTEDEAKHRREMEKTREKRGTTSMWLAFLAIALALVTAIVALFLGHATVAATIAGVTIGAIALTFAVGNTTEAILQYFQKQTKPDKVEGE